MKFTTLLLAVLLLAACGPEGGKFVMEGRLRNMNQAEFWVYSMDGVFSGIDTIRVRSGRFRYEKSLDIATTLVVIFPNYSEQAVFARPGSEVSIKGDATHLKEMVIEGTRDNEDMTTLRMKLNDLVPPDVPGAVEEFITKRTDSPVSIYLLERYFIQTRKPDLQRALQLTSMLLKDNPDNGRLMQLKKQLKGLQGAPQGGRLPRFSVKDIKGGNVTEKSLDSKVNIVFSWATWSFPSSAMQNRLKMLKQRHGKQLAVVGVCLDADRYICERHIRRDSLPWPTVCDGRLWDTPLMQTLSMTDVPDNVIADSTGRIVARSVALDHLEEQIDKLIHK